MFNPLLICALISAVVVQNVVMEHKSGKFESKQSQSDNISILEFGVKPSLESQENEKVYSDSPSNTSYNDTLEIDNAPKLSKAVLDLIFPENIGQKGSEIVHSHSNYVYPKRNNLYNTISQPHDLKGGARVNPIQAENSSPKSKKESKNRLGNRESSRGRAQNTYITNKNNKDEIPRLFNNNSTRQPSTKKGVVGGSRIKPNTTVIAGIDDRASFGAGCSSGMTRVLGECMEEDK